MLKWLKQLLSGKPHFIIGNSERQYLLRWYLIPRNHWLNIYLHKFVNDDDDRALHDHPWWFLSFLIKGKYVEYVQEPATINGEWDWAHSKILRQAFSAVFRKSTHIHRVELLKDSAGNPIPAWTIIITGPKTRVWGFWCPKGFVPWYDFTDEKGSGIGKGCGE